MATMTFNPQTPQSPSQFSPTTADPLSSMSSSMTSITTASSLPTPAHSINGTHPTDSSHDVVMSDAESPHKRKRLADDHGNREQKKLHLDNPRRLGIEDLHLDVGPKPLLCRTPHFASFPRSSDDLFEKFGLTAIAAEVARTKPNGEKNALRKTFKGQMRALGINGAFDPVKKDDNDPEGFMHLLNAPEDGWYVHEVAGKEIERGFSEQVKSSLTKATTMAKGPIAKSVWDSAVLGDLAPRAVAKKPKDDTARQTTTTTTTTTPGTPVPLAASMTKSNKLQVPQADRSRRNIKKRSYQDSSYEGYGEGFPDDDLGAETGYSTGDGDDRLPKKRRKENPGLVSSLGGAIRQAVR